MKLFLASEAKHPESVKKFKQFIGKDLLNKKILYIPTAANGEYYGSWKGGETVRVVQELSNYVDILQLEDFYFTDIKKRIKNSEIIFIAGGMSGYLLYWIKRTGFDKMLIEALNKGVIYFGTSAGSMICSKTQESSEWLIGDEEPGASLIAGLGLIDFEIYPHYEDELYSQIEKKWKKGKLYLLKNGEVITVIDGKVEVLGEERIIEK
jgi:dipeptidase E